MNNKYNAFLYEYGEPLNENDRIQRYEGEEKSWEAQILEMEEENRILKKDIERFQKVLNIMDCANSNKQEPLS